MVQRYQYKKPRSINAISVVIYLGLAGGVYAGVKFIPPYYTAYKVDKVLADMAYQAGDTIQIQDKYRRRKVEADLIDKTTQQVREAGVGDPELQVYIEEPHVHATFTVVIKHPVVEPSILYFHRKANIPAK